MQQITITGNLVSDAQIKTRKGPDGQTSSEFVTFKVACNTNFGETKETTYYDVSFRKSGVFEYLKKGQPVLVSGMLRTNTTTKEDGTKYFNLHIYNTSHVELCGKKLDNE